MRSILGWCTSCPTRGVPVYRGKHERRETKGTHIVHCDAFLREEKRNDICALADDGHMEWRRSRGGYLIDLNGLLGQQAPDRGERACPTCCP
ncbi:hypothetical protein N7456_006916 [Penicillium angulare]|uniref:Uncharacterized protein n=1 Tax=Penicillium angulare TaxID=116970 RepID=A0A9W9FIS1_9EURO|nr:hypothetical protein N7456_006916 [Penicillium angulare]